MHWQITYFGAILLQSNMPCTNHFHFEDLADSHQENLSVPQHHVCWTARHPCRCDVILDLVSIDTHLHHPPVTQGPKLD